MSPLVRITPTSAELSDVISERLWTLGATAIAEVTDSIGPALLVTFHPSVPIPDIAAFGTDATDPRVDLVTDVRTIDVDPDDWPAPATVRVDIADTRLVIEAGHAFGHGGHPTTRIALSALGRLVTAGASVLDVGTGTGVLALAARVLGAGPVVGIDIDPAAIHMARSNAATNRLDIDVRQVPVEELTTTFDLVVVNMLASDLAPIADSVSRAVTTGGAMFVTGLLDTQVDWVRSMFVDLVPLGSTAGDDGWVGLDFAKPGTAHR